MRLKQPQTNEIEKLIETFSHSVSSKYVIVFFFRAARMVARAKTESIATSVEIPCAQSRYSNICSKLLEFTVRQKINWVFATFRGYAIFVEQKQKYDFFSASSVRVLSIVGALV